MISFYISNIRPRMRVSLRGHRFEAICICRRTGYQFSKPHLWASDKHCIFLSNIKGTIGSIPLKDPNFRYIPWTPHVIDSCGPTCKWDSNGMDPKWWSFNGMDPNFPSNKNHLSIRANCWSVYLHSWSPAPLPSFQWCSRLHPSLCNACCTLMTIFANF